MNDQYLLENMSAVPLEGDAIVVRRRGLIAVLDGDPSVVRDFLATLDADLKGLALIKRLKSLQDVDVAAVLDTPMGIQMVLTGAMHALIDEGDPEDPILEVRTPTGGIVTDLDESAGAVWLGPSQIRNVHRHVVFNLDVGVVPGGGVLLRPLTHLDSHADTDDAPVAPPPIADPPIADPPPVFMPFESIDFSSRDLALREPLPVVAVAEVPASADHNADATRALIEPEASAEEPTPEIDLDSDGREEDSVHGIHCSRNHFNNPSAAYCQVCGISMIHLTHRLVSGPRPTLGFVVFDDGATFALDRPYRLGRQPDPAAGVDVISINDAEHSLSRHHADLTFDEWAVVITDRGSTNGTFVWDHDANRWERLQPNVPTPLATGAHIALGRRTLTYESATRS